MLLPEALKSGGIIKYFFKKIFLFFLKDVLKNQVKFISITTQENLAIKKYFPDANIFDISNPIPFDLKNISNDNKKIFVYFGRIHPHKNLYLLIQSFLEANLDKSWKLHLYAIKDDEKYLSKLKKLIGSNDQVEIKDPIFGHNKQNIMREAWINVLISKSEVLSLSILESSAHQLPTLVNENIETIDLEDSVIPTTLSIKSVKEKILEISQWNLKSRLFKGKNIYENVKKLLFH